jgi:hypothetical protein
VNCTVLKPTSSRPSVPQRGEQRAPNSCSPSAKPAPHAHAVD